MEEESYWIFQEMNISQNQKLGLFKQRLLAMLDLFSCFTCHLNLCVLACNYYISTHYVFSANYMNGTLDRICVFLLWPPRISHGSQLDEELRDGGGDGDQSCSIFATAQANSALLKIAEIK